MENGMMLDTNIFNRFVDGRLDESLLEGFQLYATHIQRDELSAEPDDYRKAMLLASMRTIGGAPTKSAVADVSRADECGASDVPTEGAAWGVSRWGQAKWGDQAGTLQALKAALDARNKGKKNNMQDALIGETAIKNGFILMTTDRDLQAVVEAAGGKVMNPDQKR